MNNTEETKTEEVKEKAGFLTNKSEFEDTNSDFEFAQNLIDNEFPDYLQKYMENTVKSFEKDPFSDEMIELFAVHFSAARIYYEKEVKKNDCLNEADFILENNRIYNALLKGFVKNKILDNPWKALIKKVREVKIANGVDPDTALKDIEDLDKRNAVDKQTKEFSMEWDEIKAAADKKIKKYFVSGGNTVGFTKKVNKELDFITSNFVAKMLQKKFHERKADAESIKSFEDGIRSLFDIYNIKNEEESFILLRHMFVNIKRNIHRLSIDVPQMYCFCGSGEMTGKTALCNSIWRVASNNRDLEDDNKNSRKTQNIRFDKLLDRFSVTDYFKNPIIHIDEKSFFEKNQEENLKNIISSPTVSIERKGCDPISIENRSTIIVSLNDSADMIMHDNTKERRRAIIEFPDKDCDILKKMNSLELDKVIEGILVSAPSEYYYDIDEVVRVTTEHDGIDGILEGMISSLDFCSYAIAGNKATAQSWVDHFSPNVKMTSVFFRNYAKRHPNFFECLKADHGCLYFKPTEELINIFNTVGKENDCLESADIKKHVIQFKM